MDLNINIKNDFKRLILFVYLGIFSSLVVSCKDDDKKSNDIEEDTSEEVDSSIIKNEDIYTLKEVNLLFENSASMNGYLGDEDFRGNMYSIINEDDFKINNHFANTGIVPQNNLWDLILNKNIKSKGVNSDSGYILEEAIKRQNDSTISIVVTDGIYSSRKLKTGDILDKVVESNIKSLMGNKNFDTVIIKCLSNFDGTYYIEDKSCARKSIKLNQKRPYYIFIFGKAELINSYFKKGVAIEDLDGFENTLRLNTLKELKPSYTILSKGSEKKGKFKSGLRKFDVVHSIEDAESKSGSKKDEFQFAVALDYSSIKSVDKSFLINPKNYEIESKYPYEILEVKSVDNISSQAKDEVERFRTDKGYNFTHYMVIRANNRAISGDINIIMKKEIPVWASSVGLESDCKDYIDGNTSQTYTLDKIISGISKTYNYHKINEYFTIKLTVKI